MSNQELFSQGGAGLHWEVQCFEPRSPDGHARLIGDISPTLNRMGGGQREPCVVMSTGQGNAEITADHAPTLNCNHEAPIVSYGIPGNWIGREPENGGNAVEPMKEVAPCLTKTDRHGVCAPGVFFAGQGAKAGSIAYSENVAPTLKSSDSGTNRTPSAVIGSTVRRLTPTECERLQGFPDDWTRIPWRGKQKEDCPDGPRYKALGNSMAVPVMRWIGERIQNQGDNK